MKWGIELSDLVFSTYITQLLKHVQGSFIMECYLVLDVVSNIQQLVQQSWLQIMRSIKNNKLVYIR